MKINVLSRSFLNVVRNQKVRWNSHAGGDQGKDWHKVERQQVQRKDHPIRPDKGDGKSELCVEDIKVSADRKYMYCKGCVRSQGHRSKANVVVAVEWLDEDRRALNTDWKRIEMIIEGKTMPRLPSALQSFIVKAPLDRRVKWVKAYAFSGTH